MRPDASTFADTQPAPPFNGPHGNATSVPPHAFDPACVTATRAALDRLTTSAAFRYGKRCGRREVDLLVLAAGMCIGAGAVAGSFALGQLAGMLR